MCICCIRLTAHLHNETVGFLHMCVTSQFTKKLSALENFPPSTNLPQIAGEAPKCWHVGNKLHISWNWKINQNPSVDSANVVLQLFIQSTDGLPALLSASWASLLPQNDVKNSPTWHWRYHFGGPATRGHDSLGRWTQQECPKTRQEVTGEIYRKKSNIYGMPRPRVGTTNTTTTSTMTMTSVNYQHIINHQINSLTCLTFLVKLAVNDLTLNGNLSCSKQLVSSTASAKTRIAAEEASEKFGST